MWHSIDFIGIEEKLFILQHISCGSKENAHWKKTFLQGEVAFGSYQLEYALKDDFSYTESIVSNYMIECAVKTRMIQDHFKEVNVENFQSFDKDSINYVGGDIGQVIYGDFNLTLRESCNKIIHTNKFYLAKKEYDLGSEYWNGICYLEGERNGKLWKLEIKVREWAAALSCYYTYLSEDGNLAFM